MVALLGIGLFFLGMLLMTIAGIWGLVLAFQDSVVWGVLYLLVPFAALVFIIKKWSKKAVRNSFFLGIGGLVTMILGGFVGAMGGQSAANRFASEFERAEFESQFETIPPDALPGDISSPDPTVQPTTPAPADPNAAPTTPDTATTPTTSAPTTTPSPAASAPQGYHQTMMVGYSAYNQGDYQTALINFRRALEMQPGDRLATEAIQNTESIIQQQ
jgi:hypothetical protein